MLITVPQTAMLHDEPHDYFRYTPYSLRYILEDVGFTILSLKPRGGYFWVLANMFKKMKHQTPKILRFIVLPIFSFLIPLFLFYLDKIDKKKKFTLGYEVVVMKKCQ